MINMIIDNWYMLFTALAVGFVGGYLLKKFLNKPTDEQIKNIKSWLVLMCVKAEKELGSGTGQLKLRLVYDWFINKFPTIANIIAFDTFSTWVDDALIEAKHLIETNEFINNYVGI